MEKRIIMPNAYVNNLRQPIIFLAGPIRYASDWQEKAIDYLISNNKEIIIANPRWDASQRIKNLAINGEPNCLKSKENQLRNYLTSQRPWERHYIKIASRTGAVLFWLANAPGLMTRVELGQLMTEYKHDNSTKFCVGGEKDFADIETIKDDLSEYAPDKRIFETLEETCSEAIRLAHQK